MINVKENEKEKKIRWVIRYVARLAHTQPTGPMYIGGEWFSNPKLLETNSAETGGRLMRTG